MSDLTKEIIKEILDYSRDFKLKSLSIPYSALNPLMYFRALETHISHIFADILRYKVYDPDSEKLSYPILESFIQRFFKNQEKGFVVKDVNVISPQIQSEYDYIDILVKDKNYVIIIENKINGATYLKGQPARYINRYSGQPEIKVLVALLPQKMGYGKNAEKEYIETEPKWSIGDGKIVNYICPGIKPECNAQCYVRAIHRDFAKWLSDIVDDKEIIPEREVLLKSNILNLIEKLNEIYGVYPKSYYEMEKIELLKDILGFTDDLAQTSCEQLFERKKKINEICEGIKDLNEKIDGLWHIEVQILASDFRKEIEDIVAEDNRKTVDMGDEPDSWIWPIIEDYQSPNPFFVETSVNGQSISIGVSFDEKEAVINTWAYCRDSITAEVLDKVNGVLNELDIEITAHESNGENQYSSGGRHLNFSKKKEIKELIEKLLALKYKMRR